MSFSRRAWVRLHTFRFGFDSKPEPKPCLYCQRIFQPVEMKKYIQVHEDKYCKCLFCSIECSESYIARAFSFLGEPRGVNSAFNFQANLVKRINGKVSQEIQKREKQTELENSHGKVTFYGRGENRENGGGFFSSDFGG